MSSKEEIVKLQEITMEIKEFPAFKSLEPRHKEKSSTSPHGLFHKGDVTT